MSLPACPICGGPLTWTTVGTATSYDGHTMPIPAVGRCVNADDEAHRPRVE